MTWVSNKPCRSKDEIHVQLNDLDLIKVKCFKVNGKAIWHVCDHITNCDMLSTWESYVILISCFGSREVISGNIIQIELL